LLIVYKSHCGACKAAKPNFEEVAAKLAAENHETKLAAISMTSEKFVKKFGVTKFPTFLYFSGLSRFLLKILIFKPGISNTNILADSKLIRSSNFAAIQLLSKDKRYIFLVKKPKYFFLRKKREISKKFIFLTLAGKVTNKLGGHCECRECRECRELIKNFRSK